MKHALSNLADGMNVLSPNDESGCGCSKERHRERIASGAACCGARSKNQAPTPELLARDNENLCQD